MGRLTGVSITSVGALLDGAARARRSVSPPQIESVRQLIYGFEQSLSVANPISGRIAIAKHASPCDYDSMPMNNGALTVSGVMPIYNERFSLATNPVCLRTSKGISKVKDGNDSTLAALANLHKKSVRTKWIG